MRHLSLPAADRLHECAASFVYQPIVLRHEGLAKFAFDLAQFESEVTGIGYEPTSAPVISVLRRYRYLLCAQPLPFEFWHGAALESLRSVEPISDHGLPTPRHLSRARDLSEVLVGITQCSDNPVLEALRERQPWQDGALLLRELRWSAEIERVVTAADLHGPLTLMTASQLKDVQVLDMVAMVGPPRWYPDFCTTAPRASLCYSLRYSWIGGGVVRRDCFGAPLKTDPVPREERSDTGPPSRHRGGRALEVDPDEVLPSLNWAELARRVSICLPGDPHDEEVPAQIFELEGGLAVCLEVDGGVITIDPTQDGRRRVQRIPVASVEANMFILLRTSGSGDYVVPVADQVLGGMASELRNKQAAWKAALRQFCFKHGAQQTCARLSAEGAGRATENNLRNWMHGRNIRPELRSDFDAIMKLIERPSEAEDFWQAMELIDRAHRRAGFRIRKSLLRHVLSSDLRGLQDTGRMEFEPPGLHAVSMAALRVVARYSQTVSAAYGHLGRPMNIQDLIY
jgi:hypothetical protein